MKTKKTELSRLQTLIESDRLSVGDAFCDLVTNDLTRLLSEYFDLNGVPSIEILKCGDKLSVNLKATATRLKTFVSVPTD